MCVCVSVCVCVCVCGLFLLWLCSVPLLVTSGQFGMSNGHQSNASSECGNHVNNERNDARRVISSLCLPCQ